MELIQEWTLLDDAGRNLCRHVLQDNCRTPAPRGKAFATLVLPVCRCSFFLFFKITYLFIYGCAGSFFTWGEGDLLSGCGARVSHCSDFSCYGVQALGCAGFSSCGSLALEHWLGGCGAWA